MDSEQKNIENLPISARLLDNDQQAEAKIYRIVKLEPSGMTLATEEKPLPAKKILSFAITIFGVISFKLRAQQGKQENKEVIMRFVEIDQNCQKLLEETFRRFSHLKFKELDSISSSLGKAARKRFPTNIAATMQIGEIILSGKIENLSEGGAFFACSELLPLGAEGLLNFELKEGDPTLNVQARVVWHWQEIKHGLKSYSAGAGLQFIGGTRESLTRITEFIKEKIKTEES